VLSKRRCPPLYQSHLRLQPRNLNSDLNGCRRGPRQTPRVMMRSRTKPQLIRVRVRLKSHLRPCLQFLAYQPQNCQRIRSSPKGNRYPPRCFGRSPPDPLELDAARPDHQLQHQKKVGPKARTKGKAKLKTNLRLASSVPVPLLLPRRISHPNFPKSLRFKMALTGNHYPPA